MKFFDSLVHPTRSGRWHFTRFNATMERLLTDMDRAGVGRACLVGIDGCLCNDEVEEFARMYPDRFVPIAGVNPGRMSNATEVRQEVENLGRRGFAGIKLHPRFNNYDPLDSRCLAAKSILCRKGNLAQPPALPGAPRQLVAEPTQGSLIQQKIHRLYRFYWVIPRVRAPS